MKLCHGLCCSLRSLAHKPRQNASRLKPMFEERHYRGAVVQQKKYRNVHAGVTVKACIQHATTTSNAGYTTFTKSTTGDYAHCIHGACAWKHEKVQNCGKRWAGIVLPWLQNKHDPVQFVQQAWLPNMLPEEPATVAKESWTQDTSCDALPSNIFTTRKKYWNMVKE